MLVMISLAVGQFSTAGWTGYPPFSELAHNPSVGVDYWIWALQISGIGTTLTGINFLVTIIRNRAPGMSLMRMPLFAWTALCASVLMILAFPALTVVTAMLALDRYLDMHFFTNAAGGSVMNYINLFWIWGHPEVYILILPAFGVFSEVVATFAGKRLFGYPSLVYATVAITLLSFSVWLHHFFTMGAGANVNAAFGIATMVIAVPTGVKIFDWLLTLYQGRIRFTTPMLWTLGFIPSFAIGGATGVMLAVPPVDFQVHNSEFLVAHFHNMLIPGSLFGYLAGYMYWFPKAFGFRLSEKWGKRAFWSWLIGFQLAFLPLYVLGLMGMPRRLEHYDNPAWQPYLILADIGAALILVGIACLVIQLVVSVRERQQRRDLTGDPWNGRTLEWATASPPPAYNFAHIPQVRDRDALTDMKRRGETHSENAEYRDIEMPRNTAIGFWLGGLAFVLGFALIWHIWWLAGSAFLGMLGAVILRSFDDHTEYRIPAAEVARLEQLRRDRVSPANESTLASDLQPVDSSR
jgi:cytochrome o ubiquinol oxidase subunit 1